MKKKRKLKKIMLKAKRHLKKHGFQIEEHLPENYNKKDEIDTIKDILMTHGMGKCYDKEIVEIGNGILEDEFTYIAPNVKSVKLCLKILKHQK